MKEKGLFSQIPFNMQVIEFHFPWNNKRANLFLNHSQGICNETYSFIGFYANVKEEHCYNAYCCKKSSIPFN